MEGALLPPSRVTRVLVGWWEWVPNMVDIHGCDLPCHTRGALPVGLDQATPPRQPAPFTGVCMPRACSVRPSNLRPSDPDTHCEPRAPDLGVPEGPSQGACRRPLCHGCREGWLGVLSPHSLSPSPHTGCCQSDSANRQPHTPVVGPPPPPPLQSFGVDGENSRD